MLSAAESISSFYLHGKQVTLQNTDQVRSKKYQSTATFVKPINSVLIGEIKNKNDEKRNSTITVVDLDFRQNCECIFYTLSEPKPSGITFSNRLVIGSSNLDFEFFELCLRSRLVHPQRI